MASQFEHVNFSCTKYMYLLQGGGGSNVKETYTLLKPFSTVQGPYSLSDTVGWGGGVSNITWSTRGREIKVDEIEVLQGACYWYEIKNLRL